MISSFLLLRSLPRTYGTIQYEQKLLQPSTILTHALTLSALAAGTPSTVRPSTSHISKTRFPVVRCLYKSSGKACRLCVPNTISTCLYDFFIFSTTCGCCIMHPVTAITPLLSPLD